MKKIGLIIFLVIGLILFFIVGLSPKLYSEELLVDKVKFASVEKSRELLTQEDDFTRSWSQFDIDSRCGKQNASKEELFKIISKEVKPWNTEEESKIISILQNIDSQIKSQGFKIDYPEEIYFVKTSGKEEGGAEGYTRSNYIVLKLGVDSNEFLEKIIIHELFHVLTRNNPEFREEMYKIIGFNLMMPVEYPEELKKYRITNPDASQTDSYISVNVENNELECMMILYSKKDYDGGDFFKYLEIGFLSLKGDSNKKSVEYKNGNPVIYSFSEVNGFFEQVGDNTGYIIHPEEILAENFVLAIQNELEVPDQFIIKEIQEKLKK